MWLQEVSLATTDYAGGRDVAQTSKSAESQVSKPALRGESEPLSRARKGLLERGG
jgi:hypothetical protein